MGGRPSQRRASPLDRLLRPESLAFPGSRLRLRAKQRIDVEDLHGAGRQGEAEGVGRDFAPNAHRPGASADRDGYETLNSRWSGDSGAFQGRQGQVQ